VTAYGSCSFQLRKGFPPCSQVASNPRIQANLDKGLAEAELTTVNLARRTQLESAVLGGQESHGDET
jgi:hypothetical protein